MLSAFRRPHHPSPHEPNREAGFGGACLFIKMQAGMIAIAEKCCVLPLVRCGRTLSSWQGTLMPIRPNYNLRRADRRRAQQEKHEEKQQERQDRVAKRKATRDDARPLEDEPGLK